MLNIFKLIKRNPCLKCDYYHKENDTCQVKKCSTTSDRYVSLFERLFCDPRKRLSHYERS